VLIKAEPLTRLVRDIFHAEGCSEEESARIAKYLVSASLAGHDSHGVLRVPRYVQWKRDGRAVPDKKIEVVLDTDAFAVVDGGHGFGQTIAPQAVELGVRKAKANGVSLVALRHSGHIGRVGDWAEMAAEAGLVSIHFTNVAGSQLVAPFGGVDRRLSTAPFTVGFPVPGREPVILDFATSLVAEGKVMAASFGGKPLPAGSLIEPDGRLSTDPRTLYGPIEDTVVRDGRKGQGAIRAMGEHKGSGLAFICELLGGALTGSGCCGPGERRLANGMLSIYVVPAAFGSAEGVAAEARQYIDWFKSSRPAAPGGEVLVPGEPEQRTRRQRLAEGVPIPDEGWAGITATARAAGIDAERYRE
jgi:uncharacterized oxidoreductase